LVLLSRLHGIFRYSRPSTRLGRIPVLIRCRLKGIPDIGWGPLDDDTSHIRFWEFASTDLDGNPVDISQRNPVSKQLTMPQDAQTIANYSNPAFVLGGWNPIVNQ
jgi:pectinesterase